MKWCLKLYNLLLKYNFDQGSTKKTLLAAIKLSPEPPDLRLTNKTEIELFSS